MPEREAGQAWQMIDEEQKACKFAGYNVTLGSGCCATHKKAIEQKARKDKDAAAPKAFQGVQITL